MSEGSTSVQQNSEQPQSNQEPVRLNKQKRRFGLGTLIGAVLVVAVASFIIGTRSQEILAGFSGSQNKNLAQDLDYTSLEQVYDKLRESYDGQLDQAKLLEGAKKGLVDAAGDPYTVYFTDEEAQKFLGDLEGKFSGIGAELDQKDDNLIVLSTLDDSPARKSGLQRGDVIAKVNDQDTVNWSIDKAVSEIRGEKGTTVKLTVLRGQELKDFSIVRAQIVNPSVRYEVTGDKIGILRISRFAENDTVALAKRAAEEFKKQGVRGIVFDLRGNGGGYLNAAQDIASLWLENKVIVQERRGNKVVDTLNSNGDALLKGMPTVVLIDGGSASASEIVAGALHDHGAAKLVGAKTFGKGSVQQIDKLGLGGQLKVTIAKWFTPNGKNISKEGIEPDVKVELSDQDLKDERDPQKDKALEILKK
ncbi:MAG: S41 family peptidase [Candidatus Saccharimonadales bacterium]